jgi:hypothetical protein
VSDSELCDVCNVINFVIAMLHETNGVCGQQALDSERYVTPLG